MRSGTLATPQAEWTSPTPKSRLGQNLGSRKHFLREFLAVGGVLGRRAINPLQDSRVHLAFRRAEHIVVRTGLRLLGNVL